MISVAQGATPHVSSTSNAVAGTAVAGTAVAQDLGPRSQPSQPDAQLPPTAQDPSAVLEPPALQPEAAQLPPSTTAQYLSPISQSSQRDTELTPTPLPTLMAQDYGLAFPQPAIMSPQIPFPSRQTDIPETPQRPSQRRPFGSPVRATRDLNYDFLDPAWKPLQRLGSSYERDLTPTETVSVDENESLMDDRAQSKKTLLEEPDQSKRRGKRPRLTLDTVEFQKDKRKRETYYRNTSDRLKEKLQILGIYSGCIGILYLHR